MIRAAALVALLALSLGPAAAQPLSNAEYSRIVARVATRLAEAANAGEKAGKLASSALNDLPARREVLPSGGGPAVAVDNRELLRTLRQEVRRGPDGVRVAAKVMRNLQQAVVAQGHPPPVEAQRVLADVLRRSEFRPGRLEAARGWLQRLRDRVVMSIGRFIESIFERVPGIGSLLSPAGQRIVLIALLVLIGATTLYLMARLVLRIAAERRDADLPAPEAEPRMPHQQWLAEAEQAMRSGDYPTAIRALHMAALMKLDEAGHISYLNSRTDGRCIRALRQRGLHEPAEVLAGLSRLFALVWYGLRPAGPAEYGRAWDHWERLEALAAS